MSFDYREFKAEQREERRADADIDIAHKKADADIELKRAKQEADQARKDRKEAAERAKEKRDERARKRAVFFEKVRAHTVDLLIYPIALASFVLAAPAMAHYGGTVYALGGDSLSPLGWVLPVITELGMWAFALAVQITRSRKPDAPVARLQLGVWAFGAIAFTLNLVHGLDAEWSHGVVMGVVAVSGVIAHQLTVAAPPRSRAERAKARIDRRIGRKVARAQRAAIRSARVEITAEGKAELVFEPGLYDLDRKRGRVRLDQSGHVLDRPGARDVMDDEIAALIDAEIAREVGGESTPAASREVDESTPGSVDEGGEDGPGGGVATLDRPGPESTPAQQTSSGNGGRRGVRLGGRQSRSMDELRAELDRLVQSGEVDPQYTESIRKALRCAKDKAKRLRDEYRAR